MKSLLKSLTTNISIILKLFVFLGFFVFFGLFNKIFASSDMDIVLQTAGTKYIGHQFHVFVRVNTAGLPVDTISIRNLNYDTTKLQYVSTQIQSVFSSQTTLINTGGSGWRRVDIGKIPSTPNFSSTTYVNVVRFTFLPISTGGGPTGSTNLTLDFDATPSTTGTFLGGVKNLTSVTNLTINLAEDNTPPVISNCIPIPMATNVPVISSVQCDVQDFETGINLPTTTFTVNGITYTSTGINTFVATPIPNGFTLIVTPSTQFPYFTNIPVNLYTEDNAYDNGPILARNSTTLPTYTFQTENDDDPPEIYNRNPNNGAINISTNTNINFNIRDIAIPGSYPGTGIDLSTMQVTVSAPGWGSVTYTQSGSNTFGFSAINFPWNYSISIVPSIPFPQNTVVTVNVIVSDFATPTNVLNTTYSFTTLDSTPPNCSVVSPTPGSTNNLLNTSVVLNCTDSGVGIDINSFVVILDNIAYQSSGPNLFTFSGTPNNYTITITPSSNYPVNYAFEVVAMGEDFSNNKMPMLTFGLATGTTSNCPSCPTCPICQQCNNSNNNNNAQTTSSSLCDYISDLDDISVSSSLLIKENIVQIPFRTTDEELQNIQLHRINNFDISLSNIKDIIITSEKIIFEGTSQQYANVSLLIESYPILLTTIADSEGRWRIETRNIFDLGIHKVYGISRNEKTGEIIQKIHFANIDNQYIENNNFSIFTLFFYLIFLLIGFVFGRLTSKLSSRKSKHF